MCGLEIVLRSYKQQRQMNETILVRKETWISCVILQFARTQLYKSWAKSALLMNRDGAITLAAA